MWDSLKLGQLIRFRYVCKSGRSRRYSGKLIEQGQTVQKSTRTGIKGEGFLDIETKWAGGKWVVRTFDRSLMSQLEILA